MDKWELPSLLPGTLYALYPLAHLKFPFSFHFKGCLIGYTHKLYSWIVAEGCFLVNFITLDKCFLFQ